MTPSRRHRASPDSWIPRSPSRAGRGLAVCRPGLGSDRREHGLAGARARHPIEEPPRAVADLSTVHDERVPEARGIVEPGIAEWLVPAQRQPVCRVEEIRILP